MSQSSNLHSMHIHYITLFQAIRNVGLFGEGYVALHSFALPNQAGLSFTFASKQEDAVMLSAGQMQDAGRRKKDVDEDLTDVSYHGTLVSYLNKRKDT